jgi:hemerythrin superfamily protein
MYRLLEEDHRQMAELLAEMTPLQQTLISITARRRLVDRLIVVASRHEAGEEMVFWGPVRKHANEGKGLSRAGLQQEGDAKYILDAIRFASSEDDVVALCQQLAGVVGSLVAFEEQVVWPELRRAANRVGAFIWSVQYSLAKTAGPIRPHPRGPGRPFGLMTSGVIVAVIDRLRDLMWRRHVLPGAAESDSASDAITVSAEDHAEIERLLAQIEQPPRHAQLVERIVRILPVHNSIEREHLYPTMRRGMERGNDLHPHWLSDHGHIAARLAEIDRRPEHDPYRAELLDELILLVRTHIAEEEGVLFPSMRARMAEAEPAELPETLREARSKAPTRPHSHVGGAGLGARLSRIVPAPLDKARDALTGRR